MVAAGYPTICACKTGAMKKTAKTNAIECIVNPAGSKGFCNPTADACCDHYDSTGRMSFQECYNSQTQVCCKGVVCPTGTCDSSGAQGKCTATFVAPSAVVV